MRRTYRRLDEPNMSDSSLLIKVEDLISMALGAETQNLVNFKHMQTVLFMLARQLRMLEQQVEIRMFESEEEMIPEVKKSEKKMRRKRTTLQDRKGTGLDKKGKKQKDTDETDEDTEVSRRGTRKKTITSDEKQRKETEKTPEKEKKLTAKDVKPTEREKSPGDKKARADKDISSSDKERGAKKVPEDKVPGEKDRLTAIKERADLEKKYAEREKKQKIKAGISDSSIDYRDRKSRKATGRAHVGNVEVVTQAEFSGLEAAVRQLEKLASQPPGLSMPDNQTLRDDLLQGTASLTEAMQTMQVNARVQAAEEAIGRMADLLTQLAVAGALPAQLAAALRDGHLDLSAPGLQDLQQTLLRQRKETTRATGAWQTAPEPSAVETGPTGRVLGTMAGERGLNAGTVPAAPPQPETAPPPPPPPPPAFSAARRDPTAPVTVVEFDDIVTALKKQMSFDIQQITSKANASADNAIKTAQIVAEKLEPAIGMAERINVLRLVVADYAEQLNGFDAGLTTQMQGFQEQMNQMRTELKSGLEQLAAVNNNTEAIALAELTTRYEDMVVGLDDVNTTHQALFTVQSKLSDELRNLVESVEMLRDQKSDRDEVLDALRDKADISRLAGLLTEERFAEARADLERMLEICQDKFKRQDKTWIRALEDIQRALETKAGQTELISGRQDAETRLQELHDLLQRLEEQLGDPVAALLMRRLGRNSACGACGAGALMAPGGPAHPPVMPALPAWPRALPAPPAPAADAHVCVPHPHVEDVKMPVRWCGGEHTIRSQLRQRARPPPRTALTTRPYIGLGFDGRTYYMEEELQPCVECNELLEPRKDAAGGAGGAGDA